MRAYFTFLLLQCAHEEIKGYIDSGIIGALVEQCLRHYYLHMWETHGLRHLLLETRKTINHMYTDKFISILWLVLLTNTPAMATTQAAQASVNEQSSDTEETPAKSTAIQLVSVQEIMAPACMLTKEEEQLLTPLLKGASSSKKKLNVLLSSIGSQAEEVRNVALKALCILLKEEPSLAKSRVVSTLRRMLRNKKGQVQEASDQVITALHVLIRINPKLTSKVLSIALDIVAGKLQNAQKDREMLPRLLQEVVNASPKHIERILRTARQVRVDEDASEQTRVVTLLPVYHIAPASALYTQRGHYFSTLSILQNALGDRSRSVRVVAMGALKILLKENTKYAEEWFQKGLKEIAQEDDYITVAHALGTLESFALVDMAKYAKSAMEATVKLLQSDDKLTCVYALRAIVNIATNDMKHYGDFAFDAIRQAAQDRDPLIAQQTCILLRRLVEADPKYSEEGFKIAKGVFQTQKKVEVEARNAALYALMDITKQSKEYVPQIKEIAIEATSDSYYKIRSQAIYMLDIITKYHKEYASDKAIRNAVEKASKDSYSSIRQSAKDLLVRLAGK